MTVRFERYTTGAFHLLPSVWFYKGLDFTDSLNKKRFVIVASFLIFGCDVTFSRGKK